MLTMLTMPSHYAYIGHLTVLTMAISLCLLWPSHYAYCGHLACYAYDAYDAYYGRTHAAIAHGKSKADIAGQSRLGLRRGLGLG